MRALLRRIPDGFQATLNALASRSQSDREAVLAELIRGMGKEILPLVRAAAMGQHEELAASAIRVIPTFGTRAAADVLAEVYQAHSAGARAALVRSGAMAFEARGIRVAIPDVAETKADTPGYLLRETSVSAPDGVGSRSVMARLQDEYGVWHAVFVLWNDQAGVKDGFMRPMSRHEWQERMERLAVRGDTPVNCPADYARWQVTEARKLNEQTGLPLGDHLDDWDRWIGAPAVGYQPPDPLAAVQGAAPEQFAEWTAASPRLFELHEVARWFLEAADCASLARRWGSLRARAARTGSEQDTPEMTRFLEQAARELIDDEQKRLYRGRLLDLARVCEWRRQESSARQAAAAAVGLAENEVHPFLLTLVRRSLIATEALLARGEDLERNRYRPLRRY